VSINGIIDEIKSKNTLYKDRFTNELVGKFKNEKMYSIWLTLYLYRFLLFFTMSIIYMEIVFKITVFNELFNIGLVYMLLFSIPVGLILYILCTCFSKKLNRVISISVTALLTLIYIVQVVYYQVFTTFLSLFSINGAGQVLQFWYEILITIAKNSITIVFLLLPLLFIIIFGKKFIPIEKSTISFKALLAGVAIFLQIITTTIILFANSGELSTHFLYYKSGIIDLE
jgi:hypothetical protein